MLASRLNRGKSFGDISSIFYCKDLMASEAFRFHRIFSNKDGRCQFLMVGISGSTIWISAMFHVHNVLFSDMEERGDEAWAACFNQSPFLSVVNDGLFSDLKYGVDYPFLKEALLKYFCEIHAMMRITRLFCPFEYTGLDINAAT